MDAEQGYRLLTFLCGCTLAVPAMINAFEHPSKAEPFRLGRFRVVEHHNLERSCDNRQCPGKISPRSRKDRIKQLSRDVNWQFRESSINYTKLGQRYHSCLLRTRAKLANSAVCALAHEQFAMSNVSRGQDPFFKLDEDARLLLHIARNGVFESDEEEDINESMKLTHEALFLSCRKFDAMISLKFGVDAILAAERIDTSPALKSTKLAEPSSKEGGISKQQYPVVEGSSFTIPLLSDTQLSPKPSFLATRNEFIERTAQNLGRKKPRYQRNATYTWPAFRWTLYSPRGLPPQDSSPIKSRKLSLQAGHRRNTERERLFQKMIYGKWKKRVSVPGDLSQVDMYAIWPEK